MRPLAEYLLMLCIGLAALVLLANWIDPPEPVTAIDATPAAMRETGAAVPTLVCVRILPSRPPNHVERT